METVNSEFASTYSAVFGIFFNFRLSNSAKRLQRCLLIHLHLEAKGPVLLGHFLHHLSGLLRLYFDVVVSGVILCKLAAKPSIP